MVNNGPRKYFNNEKITRTGFFFKLAVSSVTFETELQLLPWRRRLSYSWLPSVYKEVWEAADAEEMPRERAIACDGKLPFKDPIVSGSPFVAGFSDGFKGGLGGTCPP